MTSRAREPQREASAAATIPVTRPTLAPLEEVLPWLRRIWDSGILTHNGPLLQQLEHELAERLGVPHVVCVASGTCGLQLSLRALGVEGEVVTTPFTYVATASVVAWEGCRPVFVDIDPGSWNLDPDGIDSRLSDRTGAILPVHVFSAPCDMDAIERVAEAHGLPVVYDATHAIGVEQDGSSILLRGAVSVLSFSATKLFNTAEGGACITRDARLAERLRRLRFFGFDEQRRIVDEGLNANLTEIHAALGLANLPRLDGARDARRHLTEAYRARLEPLAFLAFQRHDPGSYNWSFFPVLFDGEERLLRVLTRLESHGIRPRRYFHPALHTLPAYAPQSRLPVAESISSRVLCLPLYDALTEADVERICALVAQG